MYNFVGDKITQFLKNKRRSVEELAQATGVSEARWLEVINGSSRASIDMFVRLGRVFPNGKPKYDDYTYWLWLQYKSDLENADAISGPQHDKIKPMEVNRVKASKSTDS
jgi:plasmid maintenance system antidote protein VapI